MRPKSEEREGMNVFGKNERSWRKARKRGVSPIIATILLVAITVVLAAVLYVLISGLTGGGVGSKPIGTAFTVGPNPSTGATKCTAATGGCVAINDYIYTLTIESSSVNFGNVLFEVKNSVGSPLTVAATGQFTVLTTGAVIAASWTTTVAGTLAMPSSGFAFYGAAGVCGISGVA
ncbi:MAG TPA: archaellin/type IV pilin N-terminal domain-containing protein, partial [Thermoplasmata archaeon]|nr:archaellin/type IV pilin N-terminal domain-containing protein [Thermoplasmata archaeon]